MREGWNEIKMVDACEILTCGVASTPKYVDESIGVPFLSAQNVRNGEVVLDKYKFISNEFHQHLTKKNKPQKGDILYSRVGAKFGEAGVVEHEFEFSVYVSVTLMRPKKDSFNNYFFKYYLNSPRIKNLAKNSIQSSGVPNLNVKVVREFPIPIPPLAEQQQIVDILDKAFTAIDTAKANIEKNIENAKELFQSKLNQIFSQTGEGWEEKTLGEIGRIQTGTTPPTKDKSNYGDFIPFVKPAHFQKDGSIDSRDSKLSELGLKKGRLFDANSILMVCIGATIGKTGFTEIPVSSNQQINALTPSNEYVPKLLYYGLISPFVQNQIMQIGKSAQATLPIINKTKWTKLKINLPVDKNMQLSIVNTLDALNTSSIEIQKFYTSKINSLKELKKSILQKAFAGELTSTSSVTL